MKSIKQKAEKHLSSVYAGYDDVLKKLVKEAYEAGANDVLEQIEKVIQGDLSSHSAFKLKCIKQIVEELKSNQ